MYRFIRNTTAIGLLSAVSMTANAVFLTSNTIISPTVVDFSDQVTVSNDAGPIQVGALVSADITVAITDASSSLWTNADGWGLGLNGTWDSPQTYVASNLETGPGLRFTFNDGPVAQVGAFMNYYPDNSDPLIIVARDAGNVILETYDVTALADISTPGGSNAGAFRGISRPTADIVYFEVIGDYPVVDNLTFSVTAAPAPAPAATSIPTMSVYGLVLTILGLFTVAGRRFSLLSRRR